MHNALRMISCVIGLIMLTIGCGDVEPLQSRKVGHTVKKSGPGIKQSEAATPCTRF